MLSAATGFELVPVTLAGVPVAVSEARARDGSSLDFRRARGVAVGEDLLDLLGLVRDAVRDGRLVLLAGVRVREDGTDRDDGLYTFVWSIVDCAALVRTEGLLVGPRFVLRLLCSALDPTPSPEMIIETPPVHPDFSHLSALWTDQEGFRQAQAADRDLRWMDMVAIGKSLGQAHSLGALHGDFHEGNVKVEAGVYVTWLDVNRARFLYGPAEAAQCATDLLPLMMSLTPWDWYNVKRGYLVAWPDGQRVFDLIERGDRTGWVHAQRTGDIENALLLLEKAQRLDDGGDVAQQAMYEDRRSWFYFNLGETDRALAAQIEAVRLSEDYAIPSLGWCIVNLAVLYQKTGRHDLARVTLETFLARTDRRARQAQGRDHAQQVLDGLRANRSGAS